MKTVSVVMCTYNGAQYIREQLDSIVGQTYPIHELIIQDDGSTDETVAIIKEYQAKYPFIKSYINEHNLGFNLNFKSAIMKATGDYVAISDQDDVWFPEKIEKQVKAIGNYDICFSSHLRGEDINKSYIVNPKYSLEALLFAGFAGHTLLLERTFCQIEKHWLDGIIYDWSLEINAQLNNGIVMIDEPLNWHRMHPESACTQENKKYYPKVHNSRTAPYYLGVYNYYRLQQKPKWEKLYSHILEHSSPTRHQPAHNMCKCMLNKSPFALFRLCCYCLKYRHTIYPPPEKHR